MRCAGGNAADHAQRANIGQEQVTFRFLEPLRRLVFVALRRNLRAVAESLIDQRSYRVRRRRQLRLRVDQFVWLLAGKAQNLREHRQRRLIIVLRIQQQKLCLRQIGVGEAHIELRLQLVVEERCYLVADYLPRAYRLFGDLQLSFGLQCVVETPGPRRA